MTVIGRVESLHDDAPGGDRWRAKVRGELRTDLGVNTRRTVWVRLAGQPAYDLAIQAHRDGLNLDPWTELVYEGLGRVEM